MTADWADRLDDLLYDGESVVESVPVGDGRVAVTTHRLLTYDPAGEVRFRAVERPNVRDVTVETAGRRDVLVLAVRPALWGAGLVLAGSLLPVDGLLGRVAVPSGTGLGVVSTVRSVFGLLAALDELLQVVGALLLLVALVPMATYVRRRRRELVVSVAGDDDVRLPAPEVEKATVAAVREAVRPG